MPFVGGPVGNIPVAPLGAGALAPQGDTPAKKPRNREGKKTGHACYTYIHKHQCTPRKSCVPKCDFQAMLPEMYAEYSTRLVKVKVVLADGTRGTEEKLKLWALNDQEHHPRKRKAAANAAPQA